MTPMPKRPAISQWTDTTSPFKYQSENGNLKSCWQEFYAILTPILTFAYLFVNTVPCGQVTCSPGGERQLLQCWNHASAYRSKHTVPISWGSARKVDVDIRTHRSQRSLMVARGLCGNSVGKCSLSTPGPVPTWLIASQAGCVQQKYVSKRQSSRFQELFHRSAIGQGVKDQGFTQFLWGSCLRNAIPGGQSTTFINCLLIHELNMTYPMHCYVWLWGTKIELKACTKLLFKPFYLYSVLVYFIQKHRYQCQRSIVGKIFCVCWFTSSQPNQGRKEKVKTKQDKKAQLTFSYFHISAVACQGGVDLPNELHVV